MLLVLTLSPAVECAALCVAYYCVVPADTVLKLYGACRFADFEQELWGLYNLEHSDQLGKSSGWPSLDEFYRVSPSSSYAVTCSALSMHPLRDAVCSALLCTLYGCLDACYADGVNDLQLTAPLLFTCVLCLQQETDLGSSISVAVQLSMRPDL